MAVDRSWRRATYVVACPRIQDVEDVALQPLISLDGAVLALMRIGRRNRMRRIRIRVLDVFIFQTRDRAVDAAQQVTAARLRPCRPEYASMTDALLKAGVN